MIRTELNSISAAELDKRIESAVRAATEPLLDKVERLHSQIGHMRPVVTHKEAAAIWFGGEVTPETVVRYIREEGLPATQRGRTWYLRTGDIIAWQTSTPMRKAA